MQHSQDLSEVCVALELAQRHRVGCWDPSPIGHQVSAGEMRAGPELWACLAGIRSALRGL